MGLHQTHSLCRNNSPGSGQQVGPVRAWPQGSTLETGAAGGNSVQPREHVEGNPQAGGCSARDQAFIQGTAIRGRHRRATPRLCTAPCLSPNTSVGRMQRVFDLHTHCCLVRQLHDLRWPWAALDKIRWVEASREKK